MTPSRCDNDNDNLSCQLSVHHAQQRVYNTTLAYKSLRAPPSRRNMSISMPRSVGRHHSRCVLGGQKNDCEISP